MGDGFHTGSADFRPNSSSTVAWIVVSLVFMVTQGDSIACSGFGCVGVLGCRDCSCSGFRC